MTETRPRAPFGGWPTQWVHPGGFMWLTEEPRAIVTQSIVERATVDTVEALHSFLDQVVALGVTSRPGVLIVHDWRSVRAVDPAARRLYLRRAARPNRPFADIGAAFVAVELPAVARMAMQTLALGAQLLSGQSPSRLIDDPAPVVSSLRLVAPSLSLCGRLREQSGGFWLEHA